MADTRSPEQRRRIMQSVRQKNTGPEWTVRRRLHACGFRYRLHVKHLPGCPDIVLPRLKTVIFVHGCFWHGHSCPKGRLPKSREDYWAPKINANRARDERCAAELEEMGWLVMTVWQCEIRDLAHLEQQLISRSKGYKSIDKAPSVG
jgi:DNA mismatch endonuclease, patch repair protein